MGIVIDDELVRGAHGAAGEIAYLPSGVDPFDERHRAARRARGRNRRGGDPRRARRRRRRRRGGRRSAQDVFELAQGGDEQAREVVEAVARRIGIAIATVCAVIDPELVVLGGGIGGNPRWSGRCARPSRRCCRSPSRVETSRLGDKAALYGAVAIALRRARGQVFSAGLRRHARAPVA